MDDEVIARLGEITGETIRKALEPLRARLDKMEQRLDHLQEKSDVKAVLDEFRELLRNEQ